MNLKLPDCLLLLVGRTSLKEAAAASCTLFIDWASAASLAFSVRIHFQGPDTNSIGVRASHSMIGYQRFRSGRYIESNYSLQQCTI